jgi:dTDP-4-dehydrorhamnose reductase
MDVLLTGANGVVGTAVTDHLDHDFARVDVREDPDGRKTTVADARDYAAMRAACEGRDAVIHLARSGAQDSGNRAVEWSVAHADDLRMTATVLSAAADAGVERAVVASSNHAVGMYEVENAPEIYHPGHGISVDHTVQPRPDSMYGVTKVYGEATARLLAEAHGVRCYALRIGAVRPPAYDHPYGDAEAGVERGDFERGSDAYAEQVARLKALWLSRRDCAHLVECCLRDETVDFGVFYGVSDNEGRWLDVEHAREALGYDPRDRGERWDGPSAR